MATSLVQVRIDEELKSQATQLYDALGIDLSTAVRMFLKRSVMEKGIPFSMTLSSATEDAVVAMKQIQQKAISNGTDKLSLDEINSEIADSRKERRERKKA